LLLNQRPNNYYYYTQSEAWSGVNWVDLMAAQGAFGTDFYDRSILRPNHRASYRSDRPVIKIGPKGVLGSHEIHSAPSLGQSIVLEGTLGAISMVISFLKSVDSCRDHGNTKSQNNFFCTITIISLYLYNKLHYRNEPEHRF